MIVHKCCCTQTHNARFCLTQHTFWDLAILLPVVDLIIKQMKCKCCANSGHVVLSLCCCSLRAYYEGKSPGNRAFRLRLSFWCNYSLHVRVFSTLSLLKGCNKPSLRPGSTSVWRTRCTITSFCDCGLGHQRNSTTLVNASGSTLNISNAIFMLESIFLFRIHDTVSAQKNSQLMHLLMVVLQTWYQNYLAFNNMEESLT